VPVVTSYSYDSNGNRLARIQGGIPTTGTYDDQDRLLEYGNITFTYNPNGDLQAKTQNDAAVSYDYDVFGNLRHVTLDNGIAIDYVIDGMSRRIGKKINGTLVQGFLYDDELRIAAELDGSNTVVSRFVYGTHVNVPELIVTADTTYRIVTDHLGSPRLIIDTTDGSIAQRMDYDEFGAVILDTNPGFQPFGFAGGLYDPQTKLVRFAARDYDPQIGRWTARDPMLFAGGTVNSYSYSLNDPVGCVDPGGDVVLLPLIAAGALVGAVIGGSVYAVSTLARHRAFNWGAFAGAAGAGALAGGIGVVAAPLAGALGLGSSLAGVAVVNGASGLLQAGITASTDPCLDFTAGYAISSATMGALGGMLGAGLFRTPTMSHFRQVAFPRTFAGLVPRAVGGAAGPNARAVYHGALVALSVGTVGPQYVH
jgi:RHS repeat-associated protein